MTQLNVAAHAYDCGRKLAPKITGMTIYIGIVSCLVTLSYVYLAQETYKQAYELSSSQTYRHRR